jgi:ATP-binding cassette subfamily C protein
MDTYLYILKTFRLVGNYRTGKLLLIFGLTLLMGVNSGFSIVLLIPLLQLLKVGTNEPGEGVTLILRNLADKSGMPLNIETVLLIYVILLTLTALMQYWKSILDVNYQQTFIYQIRQRLFKKIIRADWQLLNNKSKTNHLQVLTKEVPNLATYFYYYLHLITSFLMTLSFVGYAMLVSAKFTMIIILVGTMLFFILRRSLFRAFHLGNEYVDAYRHILKYIDDFWLTVKIAKVHGSESFYSDRFDEANVALLNMEYRIQKNYFLPQLIYSLAGIVVLVFVVYIGYQSDQVPLTSFFILIILFAKIFPQFISMNTDVNMILSNVASVKLVLKLDEEFPEVELYSNTYVDSLPLEKEIKIKNLDFAYPDGVNLFNKFSATIPAKKITGILGESGRGKTTLIDLIAGLQKPEAGIISIDGTVLEDQLYPGWKNSIGYLPQDSFFVDGTIYENLLWDSNSNVGEDEIMDIVDQVNATSLISRQKQGLYTHIVNYQYHFSGGERQRLALARVLIRHPQLLLLDEATSALDTENERLVMEVLANLKHKVTILFVTHKTSILPWFDKVIRIK